jgi:hypothetical protein
MKTMTPTLRRLARQFKRVTAVLVLAFASLASAQTDDLPGRVGRLADLGGSVYVSTEERAEDWVEALRNSSVTSGDNLWVADDGRAEIDYGGGQFRLAGNTNVHVARLDDRMLALFVAHGRVIVRVRVLDTGEVARVDTPNTQLALTRPGLYRIEVSEDRNSTTVVVREGEATVSVAAGVQQVLPGQTASVTGSEPTHAEVRSGYGLDGFDTWSADRDRRYERSRSASYVSRQMIGYADLDDYGRWDSSPDYGMIWYPTTVAAGWAPYRYGRWSSVTGFGWTWVDDAPWGYAPFHYGRWVHVGNRWGWCPGGYVARPAWAPALVGWYGGSGWAASVSYGSPVYGWVPLGWGEPYIPSWRNCSGRCWTRYNRPYAVNLAERPHAPPTRYANWSAPGGVTAVPGATFTGRQPVHSNVVAVRPQAIASAPILTQAPVLAKPTAATIPGAKPSIAAPPPAVRFQTKPLQVAPSAVPGTWGGDGRPRGPTSVPPAIARPGTGPSSGPTAVAPGTPIAAPAVSAPPASRPGNRPAQAPAYSSGTWGAPSSPSPQGSANVAPPRPQGSVQNRAEPRSAPPPQTGASLPRSAPPATYAPQPSAPAGRSAPPATYAQPSTPAGRSVPPATYAPQPSVPVARPAPSAAAVPPAPVAVPPPQGVRSAPQVQKPTAQRDGDKPDKPNGQR